MQHVVVIYRLISAEARTWTQTVSGTNQEMMHSLFHAFLEFAEYEKVTAGKWGTGGCRRQQYTRRAPRTLEFALSENVKNTHLEGGARKAVVGLFGEGWCTAEFATVPPQKKTVIP
jgi:hypothetical protein